MAIVPEGETSKLLREGYSNASVIHPSQIGLIAKHILELISDQKWRTKKNDIDISKYERRALTGKLAAIFSSITDNFHGIAKI